jgi:excisionase family DNA binding protein
MKEISTVEEVADFLNVNVRTIRQAISEGKLKAYKQFGRWYVLESDLVAFIKAGKQKEDLED